MDKGTKHILVSTRDTAKFNYHARCTTITARPLTSGAPWFVALLYRRRRRRLMVVVMVQEWQ